MVNDRWCFSLVLIYSINLNKHMKWTPNCVLATLYRWLFVFFLTSFLNAEIHTSFAVYFTCLINWEISDNFIPLFHFLKFLVSVKMVGYLKYHVPKGTTVESTPTVMIFASLRLVECTSVPYRSRKLQHQPMSQCCSSCKTAPGM